VNCLDNITLLVDAAGEMTAVWAQASSTGPQRLLAASSLPGSTGTPTVASLDDNFATAARLTLMRALGNRRFAIFDQARDTGANNRARVVDVPLGASTSATAPVVLPPALQQPSLLRSIVLHQNSLYALLPGQTVPFPSFAIGANVSVTAVTIDPLPMADIESTAIFDYVDSFFPSAYVVARGRQTASSARHIFLFDPILSNGQVPPSADISTQTFEIGFGSVACNAEPWIDFHKGESSTFVASWRQLNAARTGCDFNVNGVVVNDGMNRVSRGIATGRVGQLVAVWEEFRPTNRQQILWSKRQPVSPALWDTPTRVAPPTAPNEDGQTLLLGAYGDGGTIAIVWQALISTGPNTSAAGPILVSKYVNGAWTTMSSTTLGEPKAIAINAAGQGVLLASNGAANCPGNVICFDLVAYRF
jgi:hypothetical protein